MSGGEDALRYGGMTRGVRVWGRPTNAVTPPTSSVRLCNFYAPLFSSRALNLIRLGPLLPVGPQAKRGIQTSAYTKPSKRAIILIYDTY